MAKLGTRRSARVLAVLALTIRGARHRLSAQSDADFERQNRVTDILRLLESATGRLSSSLSFPEGSG